MSKVNLCAGVDYRQGYINVVEQPLAQGLTDLPENCNVIVGQFFNLDPLFEDNSIDELIFNLPVNVLAPGDLVPVFSHWRTKLKDIGSLKFSAIDIRPLGRALSDSSIDLQEGHFNIFGPSYQHKSLIDAESLKFVLVNLGFRIKAISLTQFYVNIEAVKIEESKN